MWIEEKSKIKLKRILKFAKSWLIFWQPCTAGGYSQKWVGHHCRHQSILAKGSPGHNCKILGTTAGTTAYLQKVHKGIIAKCKPHQSAKCEVTKEYSREGHLCILAEVETILALTLVPKLILQCTLFSSKQTLLYMSSANRVDFFCNSAQCFPKFLQKKMRGPNLGFQYFCISAPRGLSCLTIYTRPPK